jgi:hypothetical protein
MLKEKRGGGGWEIGTHALSLLLDFDVFPSYLLVIGLL